MTITRTKQQYEMYMQLIQDGKWGPVSTNWEGRVWVEGLNATNNWATFSSKPVYSLCPLRRKKKRK